MRHNHGQDEVQVGYFRVNPFFLLKEGLWQQPCGSHSAQRCHITIHRCQMWSDLARTAGQSPRYQCPGNVSWGMPGPESKGSNWKSGSRGRSSTSHNAQAVPLLVPRSHSKAICRTLHLYDFYLSWEKGSKWRNKEGSDCLSGKSIGCALFSKFYVLKVIVLVN